MSHLMMCDISGSIHLSSKATVRRDTLRTYLWVITNKLLCLLLHFVFLCKTFDGGCIANEREINALPPTPSTGEGDDRFCFNPVMTHISNSPTNSFPLCQHIASYRCLRSLCVSSSTLSSTSASVLLLIASFTSLYRPHILSVELLFFWVKSLHPLPALF